MSNAMVFSADSETFFLGCSETGKVWAFDCDLDAEPTRILSNCREFYSVEKPEVPDGMTAGLSCLLRRP
jgi:sugar lactone lactonase YvrE